MHDSSLSGNLSSNVFLPTQLMKAAYKLTPPTTNSVFKHFCHAYARTVGGSVTSLPQKLSPKIGLVWTWKLRQHKSDVQILSFKA